MVNPEALNNFVLASATTVGLTLLIAVVFGAIAYFVTMLVIRMSDERDDARSTSTDRKHLR